MKKSKAILMVVCAMLLVAASIMGTLAYLTSQATVTNTFSVGKVEITLDEAKVGEDGKALKSGERTTTGNGYHLMPGHEYDKDPTVTVKKGSDASYVRMMVTVSFDQALTNELLETNLDNIFTGYNPAKWSRNAKNVSEDKMTITYEYRYATTVAAPDADEKLAPLFEHINVPEDYTDVEIDILNGMEIEITAQAIQADGFKTADAAWAEFPKN